MRRTCRAAQHGRREWLARSLEGLRRPCRSRSRYRSCTSRRTDILGDGRCCSRCSWTLETPFAADPMSAFIQVTQPSHLHYTGARIRDSSFQARGRAAGHDVGDPPSARPDGEQTQTNNCDRVQEREYLFGRHLDTSPSKLVLREEFPHHAWRQRVPDHPGSRWWIRVVFRIMAVPRSTGCVRRCRSAASPERRSAISASTVLTSNKGFEEWGEIFGDEVMAAALIDRLVHHCHLVTIRGNSYRMRQHTELWHTLHAPQDAEPTSRRRRGRQEVATN
jgi:hypothetical protein